MERDFSGAAVVVDANSRLISIFKVLVQVSDSRSFLFSLSNECKRSDWVECPRSSRDAQHLAVSIKQGEFRRTRLPSRAMSRAHARPLRPIHAHAPTPCLPAFFSKRAAFRSLDQTRRISPDSLAFASYVSRLLPPPASNACSRSYAAPAHVLLETRAPSQSRSNTANFAGLACLRSSNAPAVPTVSPETDRGTFRRHLDLRPMERLQLRSSAFPYALSSLSFSIDRTTSFSVDRLAL